MQKMNIMKTTMPAKIKNITPKKVFVPPNAPTSDKYMNFLPSNSFTSYILAIVNV